MGGVETAVQICRGGVHKGLSAQLPASLCYNILQSLQGYRTACRFIGSFQHRNHSYLPCDLRHRACPPAWPLGAGVIGQNQYFAHTFRGPASRTGVLKQKNGFGGPFGFYEAAKSRAARKIVLAAWFLHVQGVNYSCVYCQIVAKNFIVYSSREDISKFLWQNIDFVDLFC